MTKMAKNTKVKRAVTEQSPYPIVDLSQLVTQTSIPEAPFE